MGGEMKQEYAYWLSDDDYNKLLFRVRGQVGGILNATRCHGLGPIVDGQLEEIMKVFVKSWKVIRGVDIPINVTDNPWPRATD